MKDSIKRKDYYEDCGYIPRLCIDNNGESVAGISLIDGSIGSCSIRYCNPRKLTSDAAIRIAMYGPYSKRKKQYLKEFYKSEWGNGRKIWWEEK